MIHFTDGAGRVISPPLNSGDDADQWLIDYNKKMELKRQKDNQMLLSISFKFIGVLLASGTIAYFLSK